eukprot:5578063-Prymnesium_polylepis.1
MLAALSPTRPASPQSADGTSHTSRTPVSAAGRGGISCSSSTAVPNGLEYRLLTAAARGNKKSDVRNRGQLVSSSARPPY